MSDLTIYGIAMARPGRAIWLAEELGIDYENDPANPFSPEGKEKLSSLNPNAKMPVITDGDFVLWESMAINHYLAKKHGSLLPADLEGEAKVLQWTFWAMTEIETDCLGILFASPASPFNQANPEQHAELLEKIKPNMDILNGALAGQDYLLGDEFTLADLNVAAVVNWAVMGDLDLSPWSDLEAWFSRCIDRDAAKRWKMAAGIG